jgi:DNA-3-methyladenine glycosylase II
VYRKAVNHLKRSDPRLVPVIERVGRCHFEPRAEGTHFDALVRSIVYQQLSGKAAGTIYARVKALYGGREPTAAELLETPDADLRAAGLSRQKLGYVKDLAEKVVAGEVPIERIHELDDDAVVEALTRVKGVGRWTAHMVLMFRLGRLDVLPDLDLGIQKAVMLAYELPEMPKPREVERIGARWRPYATIASWYLWRSLDGNAQLGAE